jgi:regulator of cell morphogenesis and NO signaling
MSSIAPTASLAELAAEQPARTRLFERLHLDYCCGGSRSLAAACADPGRDAATGAPQRAALEGGASAVDPVEDRDWRRAGIAELCDHIVSVHHERLRAELPRIAGLLATVVRVHGEGRPELEITERAFAVLRAELEPHLAEEEEYLFPACRALAGGYDDAEALCSTHRALLAALRDFESDLHRHVHEENNLLFPRVLELAAGGGGRG